MQNHFSFLKGLNYDQDVTERLSILLRRVVEGSSEVYRTPLAKDDSAESLLSKFNKIFEDKRHTFNKELVDLEMQNKLKFGPMSIAKNWNERKQSVYSYFEESKLTSSRYSDLLCFPKDKGILRPLSLTKASDFLKNDTNSGLPFYTRKGRVKSKVLDKFDMLLSRKDPCIMFTRTQENGKTRTVWGFPVADTLNEMMFYRPLLDYQRKLSWRAALLGPEQVNDKVTNLVNSALLNGDKLISIDFSAFDASVKLGLQTQCFEYIKYLFQKGEHERIDYIANRFGTIGLLTPDGVISGNHGVPSGSTFTNEVDSISQYLIAMASNCLDNGLFQIQGDDGVYSLEPEKVEDFLANFKSFGLNVNIDKSYVSDNHVIYLQNLFHNDYRRNGRICGIYPVYRALNRLIFQESWDNFEDFGISGKDYYSIRSISILENCKYHPLFEEFVKFICKIDKYNLQVTQKGLTQYVEMMSSKLGTEGQLYNQHGDNIKGIRNFETFKVIQRIVG